MLIVLVLLLAYIIYLFASYHRIPDNQPLQVEQTKESISSGDTLTTEKEYSALTYNIGFGAYTPDFSFFMDGGKSSWAKSKESVKKTVQSAGELVASKDPDFALIEEVDLNSTRSYHVDEYSILKETIPSYNTVFAQNYDSAFLFYPLNQPHGKSRSGLALFSKYPVTDSLRRSFPYPPPSVNFLIWTGATAFPEFLQTTEKSWLSFCCICRPTETVMQSVKGRSVC